VDFGRDGELRSIRRTAWLGYRPVWLTRWSRFGVRSKCRCRARRSSVRRRDDMGLSLARRSRLCIRPARPRERTESAWYSRHRIRLARRPNRRVVPDIPPKYLDGIEYGPLIIGHVKVPVGDGFPSCQKSIQRGFGRIGEHIDDDWRLRGDDQLYYQLPALARYLPF
jgi:hypothetical protein